MESISYDILNYILEYVLWVPETMYFSKTVFKNPNRKNTSIVCKCWHRITTKIPVSRIVRTDIIQKQFYTNVHKLHIECLFATYEQIIIEVIEYREKAIRCPDIKTISIYDSPYYLILEEYAAKKCKSIKDVNKFFRCSGHHAPLHDRFINHLRKYKKYDILERLGYYH